LNRAEKDSFHERPPETLFPRSPIKAIISKEGKPMIMKKVIRLWALVGTFILFMSISVSQAQTPFDITVCVTGPAAMLSSSQELIIVGVELKGIVVSNHENKVCDNFLYHFLGVSRIMAGQVDARGYSKLTDLNGDLIFMETTTFGPSGKPTWKVKFLYGTGKWKGIAGGGDVSAITKRSPFVEGTYRGCYKTTGTFELSK